MNHSLLLKILKIIATAASGFGKRKKLFILIFHRVLDNPDFMRPGEVDINDFSWQMELISKYFNALPIDEAIQKLRTGSLPSRAVCITFDDGYADNYDNALPILKKFNLSAIFFIASGFLNGGRMWNDTVIEAVRNCQQTQLDLNPIGLGLFNVADQERKQQSAMQIIQKIKHLDPVIRADYAAFIAAQSQDLPDNLMMTGKQVIQLQENGMEIGGHTISHPILAKLDDEAAWIEIKENKTFLENLLNRPIRFFAYPNGKPNQDYLQQQIPLVSKAGFQAAVSTRWGACNQTSDIWQLPRFTPWDKTPIKFMLRMISIYIKNQ